jgi:hypothetical protein
VTHYTRRSFIGGVASIAALSMVRAGAQKPHSNSKLARALAGKEMPARLCAADGAMFTTALNILFPGITKQKRMAKLLKHACIVTNKKSSPLYSCSVGWRGVKENGKQYNYHRTFVKRSTKYLTRREVTGQHALLDPGHSALVTPYFFWSSKYYYELRRKHPNSVSNKLKHHKKHLTQAHAFVSRFRKNGEVKSHLRGMVWNVSVTGIQAGRVAKAHRNHVNAEHDEAVTLTYKLAQLRASSSLNDAAVLRAVASSVTARKEKIDAHVHSRYNRARLAFAHKAGNRFKAHGLERLESTLARVSEQPRCSVRKA